MSKKLPHVPADFFTLGRMIGRADPRQQIALVERAPASPVDRARAMTGDQLLDDVRPRVARGDRRPLRASLPALDVDAHVETVHVAPGVYLVVVNLKRRA